MSQVKTRKVFWKPVRPFSTLPSEGLIHAILADDQTEFVCDVTELEAKRGSLELLMFAEVCADYKAEFDQGHHRSITDSYERTVRLLKEIEASEKAQA